MKRIRFTRVWPLVLLVLFFTGIMGAQVNHERPIFSPALAFAASSAENADRYGITDASTEANGPAVNAGMVESMLSGSLTGVLFGYPYTGVSVVDIAIVAVILFVALKLTLAKNTRQDDSDITEDDSGQNTIGQNNDRQNGTGQDLTQPDRTNQQQAGTYGNQQRRQTSDETQSQIQKRAQSAWDALRSTADPQTPGSKRPGDFDEKDFLDGAKILFSRLQAAWANRNIQELEPFITPEMLDVLKDQSEQHPETTRVEVLLVNADLISVTRDEEEERAKVLFTALIQEGDEENAKPTEIREIWHFTHDIVEETTWQLDAIEGVSSEE